MKGSKKSKSVLGKLLDMLKIENSQRNGTPSEGLKESERQPDLARLKCFKLEHKLERALKFGTFFLKSRMQ